MKRGFALLFCLLMLSTESVFASWVDAYKSWTALAVGKSLVMNGHRSRLIPDSKNLVELRMNYGQTPFYGVVDYLSAEEIEKNNENLLRLSKLPLMEDPSLDGLTSPEDSVKELSEQQVRELYDAMVLTPVVLNQRNYGGRGVGFCFGRALIAHYHALIRGVDPNSVRKIWVVGDMSFWGHHVATIVKVKNDWMAVDNYTGVMNVESWITRMKQEKKGEKPLMFFITRAGRFGHQLNNLYNPIDLFNIPSGDLELFGNKIDQLKEDDFFKGFFMDFFDYLDNESVKVEQFVMQEQEEEA